MLFSALAAAASAAQSPPPPAGAPASTPTNVRDAKAQLAAAPKVTLTSGLLTATVLRPDAVKGFYRGTRFDWGGIISSVTLAGHEYYGLWFDRTGDDIRDFVYDGDAITAGPNTAALGPAESFDPSNPPGWDEAAPGQGFLKIGVGLLRKPNDGAPYSSFRLYEFVDHGRWKIAHGAAWASFKHTLRDAATGYGYVYTKIIRLVPGSAELRIEHELTNSGTRPIATAMFNHNFLTFGGMPTAQLPTVSAPYPFEAAAPPRGDAAVLADGRIQYRRALAGEEIFSVNLKGYASVADARFTIADSAGASVSVTSDRSWSRLLLWSIRRTVAMEPYVALSAAPGKTIAWSSRYQFAAPR